MTRDSGVCPVCSGVSQESHFKGDFRHRMCLECGAIFVIDLSEDVVLSDLYQKSQGYVVPVHPGEKHFGRLITRGQKILSPREKYRVLDIGCASGNFLDGFSRDHELHGCDVNAHDVMVANTRGFRNIEEGSFLDLDYEDNYFDWVNLGDVLEHVPEPSAFLEKALRVLKQDGLVTLSTPDIGSFWARYSLFLAKVANIPPSVLSPPFHLINFSRESLEVICEKVGFRIVEAYSEGPNFAYEVRSAAGTNWTPRLGLIGTAIWLKKLGFAGVAVWLKVVLLYFLGFVADRLVGFLFKNHSRLNLKVYLVPIGK